MTHNTIMAIDPGNERSGFVIMKGLKIIDAGKLSNDIVMETIRYEIYSILVCEMIASYGMAVGQTVFDTCVWIGRFLQAAKMENKETGIVFRKKEQKEKGIESVCMYICHNARAKDKNIRQAIIDMYPATGGGKIQQVGTKKQPGPLYGISGDMWSALAIAITYQGSKEYRRLCE